MNGTPGFAIRGINHIGIAAKDTQKAKWFFQEILQLSFLGEELVNEQGVNTLMFASSHRSPSGEGRLELLEATTETSPIAKFLSKKGGGLHHLAIEVEGLVAALAHLQSLGVRLIDTEPRQGAHGSKVAFIHPEACGGLLIELVEINPT